MAIENAETWYSSDMQKNLARLVLTDPYGDQLILAFDEAGKVWLNDESAVEAGELRSLAAAMIVPPGVADLALLRAGEVEASWDVNADAWFLDLNTKTFDELAHGGHDADIFEVTPEFARSLRDWLAAA